MFLFYFELYQQLTNVADKYEVLFNKILDSCNKNQNLWFSNKTNQDIDRWLKTYESIIRTKAQIGEWLIEEVLDDHITSLPEIRTWKSRRTKTKKLKLKGGI
jgi:hypothetical protein